MEAIIIVVVGLMIGSFLNVVIYRVPLDKSIVTPRSQCPSCGHLIRFYDNIPIFSYIILRMRCRDCKAPISIRYPLVEFFTAVSAWLSFYYFGIVVHYAVATAVFLFLLIVLALIDYDHKILPDSMTLGGAVVFLGYSFFNPVLKPLQAFICAFGAALIFAGIYYFYLKVRKIEGLGQGDIKMMLLLGAFLGVNKLVVGVMLASFCGLFVGIFLIIFKGKDLKFQLPFGTFLSIGCYISLFWGEKILMAIKGLYPSY